jgi:hypothetical protein
MAGVVTATLITCGCMSSKVSETRQVAASIQANESIVVLKKPQLEGTGTEEKFLDCRRMLAANWCIPRMARRRS